MLQLKNILFAQDFSAGSDQALPYALDLADRTGATLHLVYADVLHGQPFDAGKERPEQREQIRERLEKHATDLPEHRVVREVVRDVAVAPALLRYAEEHAVDLVVMGTHGRRGIERVVIGSVAEEVVRKAACPVLTVRQRKTPPGDGRVTSILVPIDFSSHSREALRYARALATSYGARLTLLHVVEETLHPAFYGPALRSIYDVIPDIEDKATAQLERLYGETAGADVEARFVARPGRAARAVTRYAEEEGHDLIVMATHGRTGVEHFLIGSVAEKVVRRAPCPVFTVQSFGKSLLSTPPAAAEAEGG